jgi:predicted extracellular nuclease
VLPLYGIFTVAPVRAEIRINEVLSNPVGSPEVDEFIELYNTGDESVDISAWTITDKIGTPKTYTFSQTVIEGKSFISVTHNVSQIVLNNTADGIVLKNSAGDTIDELNFEQIDEGISLGRFPDGHGEFVYMSPSETSSNFAPPTPTPTETPTPTKTTTPTKTLTPTRTPTTTKSTATSIPTQEKKYESAELDTPKTTEKQSSEATYSASYIYDKNPHKNQQKDMQTSEVLGIHDKKGGIAVILGAILIFCACGILLFQKYKYIFIRK